MRHGNPWIHQRMIEEGFRMTQARKHVLAILSKSSMHLSAEEIYLNVRAVNPSVGFATVYRTLDLLTNMGIVQKFSFGDGRARYELLDNGKKETHHHHLICARCRKIVDYTDFIDEEKELIQKIGEALSKKHGFDIKSHIINFYGLCENCKKVKS